MSNQLLSSKVIVQEEEPQVHSIPGVATAVYGVVGVAERGPYTPQQIFSPGEYKKLFGGYTANGYLAQAVDAYFGEGGVEMWIQRVCHFTDVTNPATKTSTAATATLSTSSIAASKGYVQGSIAGPFDLEPSDTLLIDVDAAGAPTTVTVAAVAAARECATAETYHIDDLFELTVKVDRGAVQTIQFLATEASSHTAWTAEEVAAVINAKIAGAHATVTTAGTKVTITSDRRGTGSYIEITGGTANAVLNFNTAEVQGTGNVSNVNAVTVAEIKAMVELAVATVVVTDVGGAVRITRDATGTSKKVQVTATSTADDKLGLDNALHSGTNTATLSCLRVDGKTDGTYANSLSILIAAATSGDATRFNLSVLEGTTVLESYPNLSMLDSDTYYVEKVINDAAGGSDLISVTDLDAATDAASDRPANGSTTLSGGGDGLASLADADFVGGSGTGRTGLRGFDTVDDLAMVSIPGRATSVVHNGIITYCEITRAGTVFGILGTPQGSTAASAVTYTESTAALLELSEFGAIYWPWLKVSNPDRTVFGDTDTIYVPPEALVAGAIARKDSNTDGGVYQAAAGVEDGILYTCLGFETDEVLDESKRDLVYPKRINPITTAKGRPRFIDGCRTLKSSGNFPSVPERRGVIFIERSIKEGIQWARHKNNDSDLRSRVDRTINAFLGLQCRAGAFRSKDPTKAYFVDAGDALNPIALAFAGKMKVRIGLATQKPAEFIILSFSQDTRAFTAAS